MSETPLQVRIMRLLGPGRSDVSCEECFAQLDRYVEAEIGGNDADAAMPGVAAHLEGCPACAEDHASLLELVKSEGAG